MTRYTIRFQHPDGTTQTAPNAHTEVIRSYGEKTIAEMEASREDVYDEIDYQKEESEVKLVDNDTDTVVWAGLLRDVVYEGSTAIISADSYEQYAVNEEPIRNLVFSQLDDATIFRLLLSELDELSAGTVESVSDDISQSFSDVDHAKALDQIAGFGGGHPIYNEDKTVDYVESRGRDRPNTVLAPRFQNVKFVRPDRQNNRAITHLRMLGDGIKVDVVSSDYVGGDPQRWMVNDDHTDVSDRGKLASLGEQELTRVTDNLDRVRVEARDIDMALGDTLTVDYREKDIVEEQLHVTELTTVYDRGISYKATLESQIVLGRPLEYDSAPSAWVSYRCSQRSRGYTDDAVNPDDRWESTVVSTASGAVGKSVPEVAIAGDTVTVASSYNSGSGSETARLNVYDAQTGEERYEIDVDSGEAAGCLIAGPYVVAASKQGVVVAHEKYTGDEYALNATDYTFTGKPQHDDGVVYLPTASGNVVGFDLFDGFAEIWKTGTAVSGEALSPAIGGGKLYTVSNTGGEVAAYSLDDGSQQWTASASGDANLSPAYFDDVVVYQNLLSSSDDEVYALDASDGSQKWSTTNDYGDLSAYDDLNGPVPALDHAPPSVEGAATKDSDDNTLVAYVVNDTGDLRILDVLDGGSELTTVSLSTDVIPQVAVGAGNAYVADEGVPGLQVVNLSSTNTSTLKSPYSDMVVSPSVGSNVVAAVAHNSTDEREEVVAWYDSPEGEPTERQADDEPGCDATPGDTSEGEYIDRVEMGLIDNQTGDNDGYLDARDEVAALLTQEAGDCINTEREITVHSVTGGKENHVAVYVDWNRTCEQNGDLCDAEKYDLGTVNDNGGEPATASTVISVPEDTDVADVRMRVVQSRDSYECPPTEDGWYGEAEDYTIRVFEEMKYGPIEDGMQVSILDAPSQVQYPDDSAEVTAQIDNQSPFEVRGEAVLVETATNALGVEADSGEFACIAPGESRTITLSWTDVENAPESLLPLEAELCVETRPNPLDGGVADEACSPVEVIKEPPEPSGDFDVTITGTNTGIQEGKEARISVLVSYNGTGTGTGTVVAELPGVGYGSVQVSGSESDVEGTVYNILIPTSAGDAGEYTVTAESSTDSDSASFEIIGGATGDFGISIVSTNSPVYVGDTLTVTAEVSNNDNVESQRGTFTLEVGSKSTSFEQLFDDGEVKDIEFELVPDNAGTFTARAKTGTDEDTESVEVKKVPEKSGDFDVTVLSTNSPVTEGAALTADVQVTNNIAAQQSGTITANVASVGEDFFDVSLSGGATVEKTVTINTEVGDAGTYSLTAQSGEDSSSTNVEIDPVKEDDGGVNLDYSVVITSTNSPITPGGTVKVTARIENNESFQVMYIPSLWADGVRKDTGYHKLMLGNTTDTVTLTWPTGGRDLEDGDTVEMCFKTEVTDFGDRIVSDCTTVTVGADDKTYVVDETVTASDSISGGSDSATVESNLSNIDTVRCSLSYEHFDDAYDYSGGNTSTLRISLGNWSEKAFREYKDNDDYTTESTLPEGVVEFDVGGQSGNLTILADDGEITVSPP
jgi:outer membrane protein assembly factor BamB